MQTYKTLLITSPAFGWRELRAVLDHVPTIAIVGETDDPVEAVGLTQRHRPELILAATTTLDTALLARLAAPGPVARGGAKIILLAQGKQRHDALGVLPDNVVGYLLWGDLSTARLQSAVELLLTGDFVVGSRAAIGGLQPGGEAAIGAMAAVPRLKPREYAVLTHLAEGLTYSEVARAERLSVRTVERIVSRLQETFQAPNGFVLAKRAVQHGLIS